MYVYIIEGMYVPFSIRIRVHWGQLHRGRDMRRKTKRREISIILPVTLS